MEQFSYPEPMPSMSTPVQSTATTAETTRGRRRHTITRPDSAMALLSDMEEDGEEEEEEDQEAFDRISDILSNLIQEANQAVHGIEQERVQLLNNKTKQQQRRSKTPRSSTSLSTDSRIPRPRKSRIPQQLQEEQQEQHHQHHHLKHQKHQHCRNESTSSITSSTSTASISSNSSVCFSPTTSTSSSVITSQSRSPSPKQTFLFRHTALRPRSCPVIAPPPRRRCSHTPRRKIMVQDPLLMESFKRLDSSMAVVDSLSRDLAQTTTTRRNRNNMMINNNSKLPLLLLIPLLHIPHSLITMVFDFCSSPQPPMIIKSSGSSSFTVMMFWACLFAITNLMVDKINVTPKRRLSLPGSYYVKASSKRTWTPTTKKITEEKPALKRRNSI